MARRLALLAASLTLSACSPLMLSGDGSIYELSQSAALAYESGEDARAEALYQGLARAAPNDPEIWLRLGNLYARSKRPDLAADSYQRGLLLAPRDPRLWYNLGVIRQRQAHAAFIQTHQLTDETDPLHGKSQALVQRLAPPEAPETAAAAK